MNFMVHRYPHWWKTQVIARENHANSSSFMVENESSTGAYLL